MKARLALLAVLFAAPLSIAQASCPLPPIPPLGCKVGPCVCDQRGQNCHYEFICH